MNNKMILIVLGVILLFIVYMGFKVISSSTSGSNTKEQVSLITDPNPARLGSTNLIIMVKDEKGNPVKDAEVFFDLNMTAMNMGTQQGTATPQGDGTYAAAGRLTMRGPWKVSTKVTMPDGKVVNQDFDINAN